jgi:hypothetical protein
MYLDSHRLPAITLATYINAPSIGRSSYPRQVQWLSSFPSGEVEIGTAPCRKHTSQHAQFYVGLLAETYPLSLHIANTYM